MRALYLLTLILLVFVAVPCPAQTIYSTDFESGAGPEWSNTAVDVTPTGDRHFLGQFANQAAVLTLRDLPVHTQVTVSFDLYIIRSWDGNSDYCCGPDVWDLRLIGDGSLVHTTFSNTGNSGNRQAYPGSYPGGDYPDRTGAVERDTLGYPAEGDAVYHISVSFPHSGPLVSLSFSAANLEGVEWESWGLDNVQVQLSTPLSATPVVYDDGTYTANAGSLHASWLASDPSAITEYKYAIGTSPTELLVDWKSAGASIEATETGLGLETGKTYYWYVMARSGAGVWSPVGTSDGITVDATPPTQYIINTIAGNGIKGYSGDDGPATDASFGDVTALAVDEAGNVYLADYGNVKIRMIDTHGIMRHVSGGYAIFESKAGDIYAQTALGSVSRINADGSLTPMPTPSIYSQGTEPIMDAEGDILWASWTDYAAIYSVSGGRHFGISTPAGDSYVFAGNRVEGYNGDNIPALNAKLGSPSGIELDAMGDALIADNSNRRIRRVDQYGIITTFAGTGVTGRSGDGGPALNATLTVPRCLHYDKSGNLYVVDRDSNSVAMIDPSGKISTVVGRIARYWYWGNTFAGDGGPAASADLNIPMAVTVGPDGSIYVADTYNYRIRKATYASTAMPPVVRDAGTYTDSTDSLAMWWGSYDRESGIAEYQYAVGTTPTGTDVRDWTSAGTWMDYTIAGLSLTPGTTYYASVKARNGAGQWSPIGQSDGITVAGGTSTIGGAKSSAPGMPVLISDAVVTFYGYAEGSNFVWFESPDRSSAIKALGQWNVARSDKVMIAGVPQWVDGTPVLTNAEVKTRTATGQTINPLGLTVRNLANDPAESLSYFGVNPVGLLVKVWGNGTAANSSGSQPPHFYIDDGSHVTDGTSTDGVPNVGIRVGFPAALLPASPVGKSMKVTGIRTVERITLDADAIINGELRSAGEEVYIPVIKPREPSEITLLN